MEEDLVTLQISAEYRDKLRQLAQFDKRSMKLEFECLIDLEMARRYSQPQPLISIEDAIKANAETPAGK